MPEPLAPAPPGPADRPLHVDVVGDSLIRQAAPALEHALHAAGFTATVRGEPGRDLPSADIQAALGGLDGDGGDVLVIATAANDALTYARRRREADEATAAAAFRADLDALLQRFADRTVVVVNAKDDVPALYEPDGARAVNGLIGEGVAMHPGTVLADWASASRAVPAEQFAVDGLHLGPDPGSAADVLPSAAAYAGTIVDAVQRASAHVARRVGGEPVPLEEPPSGAPRAAPPTG